jgi:hypothetical protein
MLKMSKLLDPKNDGTAVDQNALQEVEWGHGLD